MKDSLRQRYNSDVIVETLKAQGIKYIACNPGATFRGVHDSVVNDENDQLSFILCCHEEIAVAVAHGYAKASGKMMAVLIHTNVGMQHASMAVFNAWCDRVPVLLLGGVGPLDVNDRRPWIDWIHTSNDQASLIRGFTKWDDQPVGLQSTHDALYRACKIARTEPNAPVYVGIEAEAQEKLAPAGFEISDVQRFYPSTLPAASHETIVNLFEMLSKAENPVVVVDYLGKNENSVALLVELLEAFAIPIIDKGARYNFPNTHPLCLSGADAELLNCADVVLALDVRDLQSALGSYDAANKQYHSYLSAEAKVIQLGLDDFLISSWSADYYKLCPVHRSISADSYQVLLDLLRYTKTQSINQQRILSRKEKFFSLHNKLRLGWKEQALLEADQKPLSTASVVHVVGELVKSEAFILTNGASVPIMKWVRKLWALDKPGCHIGESGGAGLGYGLGASIGAALAYKDSEKICINLQADGDFLFTPSALWTAAHYEVPLLIIVMNNRSYNNTKEHAEKVAALRSRDVKNAVVGSDIMNPNVDYPGLARSFGIEAMDTVETLEALQSAVKAGIQYIKQSGKPFLIDVVIR